MCIDIAGSTPPAIFPQNATSPPRFTSSHPLLPSPTSPSDFPAPVGSRTADDDMGVHFSPGNGKERNKFLIVASLDCNKLFPCQQNCCLL